MSGLRDGSRIVISGDPSPEEVAAVVAALDVAYATPDAGSTRRRGWRDAARREGIGGRVVRSPADFDLPPT